MMLESKRQPSLIEIISEPTSPYHISDEDERRIRTEAKKLRRRIMDKWTRASRMTSSSG